jgi:hypothetical protein
LPAEVELENYALKKLGAYLCKDMDKAREGIAKMRIKANEEREKLNQGGHTIEQIESVNQVMTATVT